MDGTQSLKEDLARTIRRMYKRGLVSGVGGNASARLRMKDQILITPAGYFNGGVVQGDLIRVSLEGEAITRGRPSSELPTHLVAYRTREDVNAVVHGHPPNAVGLVSVGMKIPVMTPEHAVMIKRMEVEDFVVPREDGARAIATKLKRCDVVGIRNHGFFSMGKDLHEAASRLEMLEESSKIYLAGRPAGSVTGLSEGKQRWIREASGRE
ncbi:MAG: class II aldolase/adducin family protein [Nitrososphaerota archaeon]|nr:class II aldolase/adducin family protein [Nitrososphaerota archaeon]